MHRLCIYSAGIWGVLASGLFANKDFTNSVYGTDYGEDAYGFFMGSNGTQLGVQVVGVLVIGSWTFVSAGVVFFTLKATKTAESICRGRGRRPRFFPSRRGCIQLRIGEAKIVPESSAR